MRKVFLLIVLIFLLSCRTVPIKTVIFDREHGSVIFREETPKAVIVNIVVFPENGKNLRIDEDSAVEF